MRTFIQVRDNVGFAVIHTTGELDHTVTPDHTTAIEVFTSDADQFLKKKYDPTTQTWSDAPILRYAEINSAGEIIEIKRTVFEHEVDKDTKLMDDHVTAAYVWKDGQWLSPLEVVVPNVELVNVLIDGQLQLVPQSEAVLINGQWEIAPQN
jgi:hypothetical protein